MPSQVSLQEGGRAGFDINRREGSVMLEAQMGVIHFENGGGGQEPSNVSITRGWKGQGSGFSPQSL